MDCFFKPDSIAILGASKSPEKAGYRVLYYLRHANVPNGIFPINPKGGEILGFEVYKSIDDIPESSFPPSLGVICLPPHLVLDAVRHCIERGVKGIIIESGQLGTTRDEIRSNMREINRILCERSNHPRIMGPNSIGVVDLNTRVNTSLIPFENLPSVPKHGVAVVGQTGLIASGYLQRFITEKDFPVSKICCLGNKLDISEKDILEYLMEDPNTSIITMYLEDIKEGPNFHQLLKQCIQVRHKPVIILKTGRTKAGAKMVSSHTGSMAGNDHIFNAVLQSAGAIRVSNFEELWQQAHFMYRAPIPRGNKIAVISISGAGCALSVDAIEGKKLHIPDLTNQERNKLDELFPSWFEFTNPVDIWAAVENKGPEKAYGDAIEILLDGQYDALMVITIARPEANMDWNRIEKSVRDHNQKPFILCLLGGHPNMLIDWKERASKVGIPVVKSPDRGLEMLELAWFLNKHIAQVESKKGENII